MNQDAVRRFEESIRRFKRDMQKLGITPLIYYDDELNALVVGIDLEQLCRALRNRIASESGYDKIKVGVGENVLLFIVEGR